MTRSAWTTPLKPKEGLNGPPQHFLEGHFFRLSWVRVEETAGPSAALGMAKGTGALPGELGAGRANNRSLQKSGSGPCRSEALAKLWTAPSGYRTRRRSPFLRVTLSRSRYSSRGMAYFLERPVICLKVATSSVWPRRARTRSRNVSRASW
jgi:hypothetical protein